MSRASTRTAVANYFTAAQINYVGAVKPQRDYIQEQDYEQRISGGQVVDTVSPNGSGCVLIVNLTGDERQRRADTGRGAVNDTYQHEVALELWLFNSSGDPAGAQSDYDAIVDQIFELIRADPTMGGQLWSAGEYEPWIRHEQGSPFTPASGMGVMITGVVRFTAWDWLAGSGV